MTEGSNPLSTLVTTFALMSLFAVGGANAAIPEIQRIAVDVHHWMSAKQFADIYALAQLSPGPNVLIVTLIGYTVAGVVGAFAATFAMCVPTAVLAYYVSGFLARRRAALARHHPGRAGPVVDRADGRKRADFGANDRPERGCGPDHGCGGGSGFRNAAQSALDVPGRGYHWFYWPYLTKVVRQGARSGAQYL